jgi:hypothetical protein
MGWPLQWEEVKHSAVFSMAAGENISKAQEGASS